jgi:ATP-dependent RNA helicase RhlE
MTFQSLGVSPALLRGLAQKNHTAPYPIQEKAIPAILAHKDLLGIAKTGSGKTASYVLPILMNLSKTITTKNRKVDVLVMVPTRELAVQVKDVFHEFSSFLPRPLKAMAVYGGVSINPQMKGLLGINILIATPGRLLELVRSKAVQLNAITTLVLDEADKMLALGFKEEMNEVISLLPNKRQNLLFSATLSENIEDIHQILLNDPEVIHIAETENTLDLINQVGYFVEEENKGPLLRHLLEEKDMHQVLVFVSSVHKADNLVKKLRKNGVDAAAIHGKKSQGSRTDSLVKFKNQNIRVLVATDLLARGIDIEFLPFVINYELPRSPKDFVHRIGRTGRAENPGEAITFVTEENKHHFKIIQKKMKKSVDMIDSKGLL